MRNLLIGFYIGWLPYVGPSIIHGWKCAPPKQFIHYITNSLMSIVMLTIGAPFMIFGKIYYDLTGRNPYEFKTRSGEESSHCRAESTTVAYANSSDVPAVEYTNDGSTIL